MLTLLIAAIQTAQWYMVPNPLQFGTQNTKHFESFSKDAPGFNGAVLKAVDKVQSTAMDGGGYFVGVHAVPAESPVGYSLTLFGQPMLAPSRSTSYCSGSSYAAFIEALNNIFPTPPKAISPDRLEAMRMQEPDGGRRDDFVKVWGTWNADGPGTQYALVQYTGMGDRIKPEEARPGDFMNISWKSGLGHSVVFLGWCTNSNGDKSVLFWSSQKGTNGYGDTMRKISTIKDVVVIRLTHPDRLFTFNPVASIDKAVVGDTIDWQ
ncbi:MAG TPA: hypothetical protein VGL56_15980 [Fimbriimonadaceae bacterium]|jgi:hypothetical protein